MNPHFINVTHRRNRQGPSLRKAGDDFRREARWSFVIELLLFAVLIAISAWPIAETVHAMRAL